MKLVLTMKDRETPQVKDMVKESAHILMVPFTLANGLMTREKARVSSMQRMVSSIWETGPMISDTARALLQK